MAGHSQTMPIPIPGQHHNPHQLNPQMFGAHGFPAQGHQQPMQQPHLPPQAIVLPHYIGFTLVPTNLSNGGQSWRGITPKQMTRSQEEFAEMIHKANGEDEDDYYSKRLNAEKRSQIDRILNDHNRSERDPSLEWKLANVKLSEKDLATGLARLSGSKIIITKIRVILKRVLRSSPTIIHRQTAPILHNPHLQQQQQQQQQQHAQQQQAQHQQAQHQQQHAHQHPQAHGMHQPEMPRNQIPNMQQGPNHNVLNQQRAPPPPPQGGQMPGMFKINRPADVEVLSDGDDDSIYEPESPRGKKGKGRDRSMSPDIRIPKLRDERRDSRTSSRPTSYTYDSDVVSPFGSPITSIASSPKMRTEHKRRSSQAKKYHSKKGSESSRRDRRGSIDSLDGYVMIDKRNSRGKHGGSVSSYRTHSIEDWSRAIAASRRHRNSSHAEEHEEEAAIIREMAKLRLDREHEAQQGRELQHQRETHDRLINRLENLVAQNNSSGRYDRPVIDRSYSDRPPALGYLSRSRYDERLYRGR